MTRRTTILPLLVALLLGAIGWAVASPAAYAGGPTSVLMTNPGLGRATALYVENAGYSRLEAAVGEEPTGEARPPSGMGSGDEEVRLTWLIHDMQIWKVNRVHLTRRFPGWHRPSLGCRGGGIECDVIAEAVELAEGVSLEAFGVAAGEVVRSWIVV
jgi:hypothetical protein